MNLELIKNAVSQKAGRTGLILQKHSPEILLGAGLVGMVATVVMASRATLRAGDILEGHQEKMDMIEKAHVQHPDQYSDQDQMKDKVTAYVQTGFEFVKLYGPSFGIGVLSVGAILGAHGIMAKRQVALVAAYNLIGEAYKNYRARVVAELGEEKDRDFYLGLKDETRTETVTDEDGNKTKVKTKKKAMHGIKMGSIYSRFFDESNPMFKTDRTLNKAFLLGQQRYYNDVLLIRGHVILNEVYESLGFPHTKEGAITGWVLKDAQTMKDEGRDGYIDFGIFDVENDPSREFVNGTNPTILLDFNVDGIMYDQI